MPWLELIAAVTSVWAAWLTTRRHLWCWPVGLASVLLYAWVFVDAKLYSDVLLQIAFAVFIAWGWVRWAQHLGADGRVEVARLARRPASVHLVVGAFAALALGMVMHRWTDAALPWLDATLTAFSLVAQWWQVKRHIAAWWLWIAVDVVYVGEYVYKHLLVTSVLYAGFVLLAVAGLRSWQQAAEQHAATRYRPPDAG